MSLKVSCVHFSLIAVPLNLFQGLSNRKNADPEASGQHDDRASSLGLKLFSRIKN
jgi:hypothetical protein